MRMNNNFNVASGKPVKGIPKTVNIIHFKHSFTLISTVIDVCNG